MVSSISTLRPEQKFMIEKVMDMFRFYSVESRFVLWV